MVLTQQQKRDIQIATGLGLLVLKRRRLRQGPDGANDQPTLQDEMSRLVRDLRPEVAFALYHDPVRPETSATRGHQAHSNAFELSAQLDLAEPFQDGGSQSVMGHVEAACLLPSSDRQSIAGPLFERLSSRLQHADGVKPGLIEACTSRILVYVLLERPTTQEGKGEFFEGQQCNLDDPLLGHHADELLCNLLFSFNLRQGEALLKHIVHVLEQLGQEQQGRWRWEVLEGLYTAVKGLGQRVSENVDTVPMSVLDNCAMILHTLEELTLARLRDDVSMLDTILERLISLTRLFRRLQLGEAYLWSIINKVKTLVLEQEENDS